MSKLTDLKEIIDYKLRNIELSEGARQSLLEEASRKHKFTIPAIAFTSSLCIGFTILLTIYFFPFDTVTNSSYQRVYAFQPSDPKKVELDSAITRDINNFGFNLLKQLNKKNGTESKNMVISPVSLSVALAILGNGANGQTRAEINKLINANNLTPEEFSKNYHNLISAYYNVRNDQIQINNSLWIDKKYKFKEEFLKYSNTFFDSDVFNIDFNSSKAEKSINNWVNEKTHNLIKDPVNNIDSETTMLIVNSLYFNGKWLSEFSKENTKKENFTLRNGNKVMVDMMNDDTYEYYFENEQIKSVTLPYCGTSAMVFILPKIDLDQYLASINSDTLTTIAENSKKYMTTMKVPKFNLVTSQSMNEDLSALGMHTAFNKEKADFSNLLQTNSKSLFLTELKQDCSINLDEKGTVAAAVTIIYGGMSSKPENEIKEFYLDRPFLFAIIDRSTKSVLFTGKVVNPQK